MYRSAELVGDGVRNGQDVVKALACGAQSVLIGRPWIWAMAARGEAGLTALLKTFKAEMDVSMALTAAPTLADVTEAVLDRV